MGLRFYSRVLDWYPLGFSGYPLVFSRYLLVPQVVYWYLGMLVPQVVYRYPLVFWHFLEVSLLVRQTTPYRHSIVSYSREYGSQLNFSPHTHLVMYFYE